MVHLRKYQACAVVLPFLLLLSSIVKAIDLDVNDRGSCMEFRLD